MGTVRGCSQFPPLDVVFFFVRFEAGSQGAAFFRSGKRGRIGVPEEVPQNGFPSSESLMLPLGKMAGFHPTRTTPCVLSVRRGPLLLRE